MGAYINCLRSHLLTRDKRHRRQVKCAQCIIETRNTIDEDINLILEENDVTHEVEKGEKNVCMCFTISRRKPIALSLFFLLFWVSRLVLGPYQRVMKEKQKDWSQRVARVVLHVS